MGITRRVVRTICGLASVACPCAIVWLTYKYAETGFDDDFDPWPVYAIDVLFWSAAVATIGFIWSLDSWWRWLGAVLAIPLLLVTAIFAVTGGMWIDGTYF